MSPAPQTHLPDWYPDPQDPTRLRWWDGVQWTATTRPVAPAAGTGEPEAASPAPTDPGWPTPSPTTAATPAARPTSAGLTPLIAGGLFLVAGVFAVIQAIYMSSVYGWGQGWSTPVLLPFDWYLVLVPYWIALRAFFIWALIPPIVVLIGAALGTFALARRRPRAALAVVAALLTVQNLLILVPIFIDAGVPGRPHYSIVNLGSNANPQLARVVMAVVATHVVVLIIPLVFAAATLGPSRTRQRTAIAFLVIAGLYLVWYLISFLFGGQASAYLLTPGLAGRPEVWLAPLSTLLCLAAMSLLVVPSVRDRQPAPSPLTP